MSVPPLVFATLLAGCSGGNDFCDRHAASTRMSVGSSVEMQVDVSSDKLLFPAGDRRPYLDVNGGFYELRTRVPPGSGAPAPLALPSPGHYDAHVERVSDGMVLQISSGSYPLDGVGCS